MKRLPPPHATAARVLRALLVAPGTFYQICERAGLAIETDRDEALQRKLFETALADGHARRSNLIYSLTSEARAELAPPAPYIGQVAGPAYRGIVYVAPALVVRRAKESRA
jgi:hypothetical protein